MCLLALWIDTLNPQVKDIYDLENLMDNVKTKIYHKTMKLKKMSSTLILWKHPDPWLSTNKNRSKQTANEYVSMISEGLCNWINNAVM